MFCFSQFCLCQYLGYLIWVCVWDGQIFTQSTPSLMQHPWCPTEGNDHYSFPLPPYLFPICSISYNLLLLSSVPFKTLAYFPNLCVLRDIGMCCGRCLLCGQPGAGSLLCGCVSRWPSIRYPPQADGFEGCMLSVATSCVTVLQDSLSWR